MVLAKVPVVPQWNITGGCACTPEGGFLYVGARNINYIGPIVDGSPPLVKTFITRQPIHNLDIDPGWGAQLEENNKKHVSCDVGGEKYFAVMAQDNSVQIWDFDRGCAVSGHKAHFNLSRCLKINGPLLLHGDRVLLSYMRNRNVLSVDAQELVVYCVASNTYNRHPTFLPSRNQHWTILRCSPHMADVFAVGSNRGLVLLCDIKKMCVVYTLRGHDTSITSLSWNMVNATKLQQQQPISKKDLKMAAVAAPALAGVSDDIFDIYDYDYLENEFGAPSDMQAKKCSGDSADFIGIERPNEVNENKKFDFAEACQNLKEDIDALKQDSPPPTECDNVTLADCQQAAAAQPHDLSSSCGSNESTEGSLEVLERRSASISDIDEDANDLGRSSSQQILHQAEVHATPQSLERNSESTENTQLAVEAVEKPNADKDLHYKPKDCDADVLLASASADGSFWIWNAKTGASCDHLKARATGGATGGPQQGKNMHIEVAWLDATRLLTNNKQGDLSVWRLQSLATNDALNRRYKFKEGKRHCGAHRGIVSFGVCEQNSTLWCISSHRDITCEDVKSEKLIAKFSCASTNISAMRECPDDMNKIALGFSDRRIGIIDISQMTSTNIFIENFGIRIDSPVLSLVWSPENKRLAFGTIEGRVGILNVENPKLQPILFNPVCGKAIYSIDWQDSHIFVVCNELLAIYDENSKSKDAHIVAGLPPISAMSVRGKYLFVGTQRGHLQILSRSCESSPSSPQQHNWSFDLLHDFEIASRYITEIAWSPIASDMLAVVANANHIHVFSFDAVAQTATRTRKIEIRNAKAANASVKWSNRTPDKLLTCGFDGAIRVWDLKCEEQAEHYLKQFHCPMTCGLFLPTDEEVVLCAGKSTSLEFFDMREAKSEDYSVAKWKRWNSNALDTTQWGLKMQQTGFEPKVPGATEKRRNRRSSAANTEVMAAEAPKNVAEQAQLMDLITNMKIDENSKTTEIEADQAVAATAAAVSQKCGDQCSADYMKSPTTLLYLATKEINKDALEQLQQLLSPKSPRQLTRTTLCANLFGSRAQARELLAAEISNHQHSETKGVASIFMPQLSMNLRDEVLNCIQQKKLTTWHVSLAPTLSYSFWQKCCTAFAEQLLEQGYALQAATYILALHNPNDAAQMLLERNYFKEALLIARIHLQREDPLLDTIAHKWISYLEFTGNLPGAALLCVLNSQTQRAYEMLAKVRNPQPEVEQVLQLLRPDEKKR